MTSKNKIILLAGAFTFSVTACAPKEAVNSDTTAMRLDTVSDSTMRNDSLMRADSIRLDSARRADSTRIVDTLGRAPGGQ